MGFMIPFGLERNNDALASLEKLDNGTNTVLDYEFKHMLPYFFREEVNYNYNLTRFNLKNPDGDIDKYSRLDESRA